jgi:ABC-type Fe3+-hydroxamate transport system substrate-binding protein
MRILAVFGAVLLILVQGTGFPRTVTDLTGAAVTIPVRPQVIAVIEDDPILARLAAANLRPIDPAVGAVEWGGVGLLVLPDLYATAYPALVESAVAAGVPVFRTIPITSLDGWRQSVTQVGLATGREDRAARMIRCLERVLALVQTLTQEAAPVRAVVLTPEGYTFGRGTLIADLIAAAGGINAVAEAGFADYRQIDDPTLRALAPDVLLLTPAWSDSDAAALADAFPAGRVYRLPFSPTQPRDPALAVLELFLLLHGS